MLKLHKPLSLYKQGKRKNNEDAFFEPDENFKEDLFIVCDGVGGSEKGEVASKLACDSFSEFVLHRKNKKIDQNFWNEALKFTERKFSELIKIHPKCHGMGTTLVATYFQAGKAQVFWCGDSRLYQFRNGKVFYKTKDHSFVAKLVEEGQITEEEARTHPRKNIILRAINGEHSPTELDFEIIEDIQEGDLFLLCSDGIIEGLSDEKLEQIIDLAGNDYGFIIEQLDTFCQQHSNDNYTCLLIPVAKVEKSIEPIVPEKKQVEQPTQKSNLWLLGALAAFLFAISIYFFIDNNKKEALAKVEKEKEIRLAEQNSIKDSLSLIQENELLKKDSLKNLMNLNLAEVDSLISAENDSTGKYNVVKDLYRGRYYFETGDSTLAYASYKDWLEHEWKDSLLTEKDWLNLRSLLVLNLKSDSTLKEKIAICNKFIIEKSKQKNISSDSIINKEEKQIIDTMLNNSSI